MVLGRWFWVALALVLYACAAVVRAAPDAKTGWIALGLGPLVLWLGFRWTAAPVQGVDRIDPGARAAARVAVTGFAVMLMAELGREGVVALKTLGVALGSVASLVALVRVSSLGGIAARPLRARYDAAAFAGVIWAIAAGAVLGAEAGWLGFADPLTLEYALVTASLASLGITMVAAFRVFAQRRFELGVAERAAAALWLTVLCLCLGVFAVLLGVSEAERVVPETAVLAAVLVAASSISQRPSRISRALRTAVAVTLLCAPLVSLSVVVAYKAPTHAGLILFVATILAACLGLASPRVAQRLAPERGLWLRVLDDAIRAAKEPEPRQATLSVLATIRDGLGADAGPAALHRLASRDRVVVDRAGYLHTEPSEIPDKLIEIANREPERVLSSEALRYIQVEKPEVRPVLAWLDGRGAGAAALVHDEDVCVGLMLWPAAGRVSPLSFEEVVLLRRLADHLGSATGALAQLARSRAREIEAENALGRAEREAAELRALLASDRSRQRLLIEQLTHGIEAVRYSPAMQSARLEVERLAAAGGPLSLQAPPGVDTLGWIAFAHLSSPWRDGPLVVIDATRSAEQPIERWSEQEPSPFDEAEGGTLALCNPQGLALDTQRYIAHARPRDQGLVVVVPSVMKAELDPHFADHLGQAVAKLPSLAERAEDLRALALYELVRIGYELRGKPMGLSLAGQELVNDYDWPGNDSELRAALWCAALAAAGDVVDAAELRAALGDGRLSASGPHRRAASRS